MKHVLSTEMLLKYRLKRYEMDGCFYETIMEYENDSFATDTDVLIVGFRNKKTGKEYTERVLLPIINDSGLLQRNHNIWAQVHMVIPPLAFTDRVKGKTEYVHGLLNTGINNSRILDFMPNIARVEFDGFKSKLFSELYPEKPAVFHDTRQWNVLTLESALIELFNVRIVKDIEKSRRYGFSGIRATNRALSVLISAFLRYDTIVDAADVSSTQYEYEELSSYAGNLWRLDKENMLILHPLFEQANIGPLSPIDVCTCSSSKPLVTARAKSGISIEQCKFVGIPDFPYAKSRKGIVGLLNDDPHRVVVSRAIHRALPLQNPDIPYVMTDTVIDVDSVSVPGIRMSHPMNMEDSILISETMADKLNAVKTIVDRIEYPLDAEIAVAVSGLNDAPEASLIGSFMSLNEFLDRSTTSEAGYHLHPGQELCTAIYAIDKSVAVECAPDEVFSRIADDGTVTHYRKHTFRSKSAYRGVILRVERTTVEIEAGLLMQQLRIVSRILMPTQVGDKITDGHGNKATVSAIYPDHEMPLWKDSVGTVIRAQYIMSPYIGKRLAVGAEIEDKLALLNYHDCIRIGELIPLVVPANDPQSMAAVDKQLKAYGAEYTGTVAYDDSFEEYAGVPISFRRIFRLDNNAKESLIWHAGVKFNGRKRISNNAKLGLDIMSFINRGATALVNEIVTASHVEMMQNHILMPLFHAMTGVLPEDVNTFEITRKVDKTVLGSLFPLSKLEGINRENTVLDERTDTSYGVIRYNDDTILLPPKSSFNATHYRGGLYTVHPLAAYVNRLIAEICARDMGFSSDAKIKTIIAGYRDFISAQLSGKNGLIRKTAMPVFPYTIYGVATTIVPRDPYTIRIPKRAFAGLLKNDEFADVYDRINARTCIVKRDPVHNNESVFTVNFELWDEDTIGIAPWLMKKMFGDFDGDKLQICFPVSSAGIADMERLFPELTDADVQSKQLYNGSAATCIDDLCAAVGYTSTFASLHESDLVKNPVLLKSLSQGMSYDDLCREAIKAARDFHVIKTGTALAGSMGLRTIFSAPLENPVLVKKTMDFYHAIAQNTLDAKSGGSIPALDVVHFAARGDVAKAVQALALIHPELAADDEFIAYLSAYIVTVASNEQPIIALAETHPILAATQRNATTDVISEVAQRAVESRGFGAGIWEQILSGEFVQPTLVEKVVPVAETATV